MKHLFIFKILYLIAVFIANAFSIISSVKIWKYISIRQKIRNLVLVVISVVVSIFALEKIDYLLEK